MTLRQEPRGSAKRPLAPLLASGVLVTFSWLLALYRFSHSSEEGISDLFMLTVASAVIVSSLLLGEALRIAPPVLEVAFGMLAGWLGARVVGPLEALALMGGSSVMFLVGLEIDLGLLRSYIVESTVIGLVSFSAPAAAALVALVTIGRIDLMRASLISVGVSTTSVAVVYSIIKTTGFYKMEIGQVALASAMAADVASIIAFMALVSKPSPALIIYIISIIVGPLVARYLLMWLPRLGHEAEVRIVIALLLAATLISEAVGVHGVLASFILGLALQDFVNRVSVRERVEAVISGFLAPTFFVVAGMEASMARPSDVLLPSLALLALSYPVKVASTHMAFKRLLGTAEWVLSITFGARLTVSTLIAYIGLKTGLLPPSLAGAVILSAAMATVVSGVAARDSLSGEPG